MLQVIVFIMAYLLFGGMTGFWVLVQSKIHAKAWAGEPVEVAIIASTILWPLLVPYLLIRAAFKAVDNKAEQIAKKHRI